jgi:hypothetical protein
MTKENALVLPLSIKRCVDGPDGDNQWHKRARRETKERRRRELEDRKQKWKRERSESFEKALVRMWEKHMQGKKEKEEQMAGLFPQRLS